jgi:hypothetical protein
MKAVKPMYVIIIAIIVGAVAFFGGMQYQKSQRAAGFAGRGGQFAGAQGAGGQFGGAQGTRRNGGAVMGEILSKDDSSVTVKMQDGSSKIVILSGSTSINKSASGTKDDLTTGERVAVFGTTNSDGSVTAQSIQLNPVMRGFGGTPMPTK